MFWRSPLKKDTQAPAFPVPALSSILQATSTSLGVFTVSIASACTAGGFIYDAYQWQGLSIFHCSCQGSPGLGRLGEGSGTPDLPEAKCPVFTGSMEKIKTFLPLRWCFKRRWDDEELWPGISHGILFLDMGVSGVMGVTPKRMV